MHTSYYLFDFRMRRDYGRSEKRASAPRCTERARERAYPALHYPVGALSFLLFLPFSLSLSLPTSAMSIQNGEEKQSHRAPTAFIEVFLVYNNSTFDTTPKPPRPRRHCTSKQINLLIHIVKKKTPSNFRVHREANPLCSQQTNAARTILLTAGQ